MYQETISRIRKKMEMLNITPNKTISTEKIKEIEDKLGVKLPESYVFFITHIQNGYESEILHEKAPYYGFFSFEKSLEINEQWGIDASKYFYLKEDFELNTLLDMEAMDYDDIDKKREQDPDFDAVISNYQSTENWNGTLPLCEYGCGVFFRVVVNGNGKGNIWADDMSINLSGMYCLNVDIFSFYENWLDRQILKKNNPKEAKKYWYAWYPILEFGKNDKFSLENKNFIK